MWGSRGEQCSYTVCGEVRVMVRSQTKVTVVFVIFAVSLWLVARTLTESTAIQAVILVGIGVIAPTLFNEWRSRENDGEYEG